MGAPRRRKRGGKRGRTSTSRARKTRRYRQREFRKRQNHSRRRKRFFLLPSSRRNSAPLPLSHPSTAFSSESSRTSARLRIRHWSTPQLRAEAKRKKRERR